MSKALNRLLRRARRLVDIDPEEVSLVDHAATGKVFAIIKRAKADPELTKILEAFASEDIEELMKQGDPGKLKAALKAALEKLKPYMDGLPDDIAAAIKTLAGFAAGPPAAAADYGQPPEKKAREGEPFDSESDRAAFYKSKKKPFPDGGVLGDICRSIIGAVKPEVVARWDSRRIQKAVDDGDLELEDVVIEEGDDPPHARGMSKSLKGQGDDDPEAEDLWPSL